MTLDFQLKVWTFFVCVFLYQSNWQSNIYSIQSNIAKIFITTFGMLGSIFMHVFQFSVQYRSHRWGYVTDNRIKKMYYWFTALHTKMAYHKKKQSEAIEDRELAK